MAASPLFSALEAPDLARKLAVFCCESQRRRRVWLCMVVPVRRRRSFGNPWIQRWSFRNSSEASIRALSLTIPIFSRSPMFTQSITSSLEVHTDIMEVKDA